MGYLTKSFIENIHRKDLSMEEKGSGVYAYFKTKGITLTPREIAIELKAIYKDQKYEEELKKAGKTRQKKRKQRSVNGRTISKIKNLCSELSLDPSAVAEWLEFLSVPQVIRTLELSRPEEEQQQTIMLGKDITKIVPKSYNFLRFVFSYK